MVVHMVFTLYTQKKQGLKGLNIFLQQGLIEYVESILAYNEIFQNQTWMGFKKNKTNFFKTVKMCSLFQVYHQMG